MEGSIGRAAVNRRYGLLVVSVQCCIGFALATLPLTGCEAVGNTRAVDAAEFSGDTIICKVSLDQPVDGGKALGLLVRCKVICDSAGTYRAEAQLRQEHSRSPVAYANRGGEDIAGSSMGRGHPTPFDALVPGPTPLQLWIPGSEIRHRGQAGNAWLEIEVYSDVNPPRPPRWFRCSIEKLDPGRFVERLPGRDAPPPLPTQRRRGG